MQEELLDIDFDKCRELERERLRAMSDVPALKIYDVLEKHVCPSELLATMEDLGRKCDREGDGYFVRTAEVDDSQKQLLLVFDSEQI
jgi:hypothetical protein